jgi:hypothetical protein
MANPTDQPRIAVTISSPAVMRPTLVLEAIGQLRVEEMDLTVSRIGDPLRSNTRLVLNTVAATLGEAAAVENTRYLLAISLAQSLAWPGMGSAASA